MKSPSTRPLSSQAGFTLVEIMVGLVIGLLATMVIMQVFSVFEAQKRTTTGTSDAQTNGSIALYNISRELQMAGYPFMPVTDSPLECTALTIDGVADNPSRLSPVFITDNTSDSVTIRYGNSASGGSPSKITAMNAPSPIDVDLDSNLGCTQGDRTLIINTVNCFMATASEVQAPTRVMLTDITGAAANLELSCLGGWNEVTYSVNNGNLERDDTPAVAGDGVPSLGGIVNLQAQYGISAAANSNSIVGWVDATGGTWAAPTVANRNLIKAIRVAVVARNAKREPDVVTPNALTVWIGGPTINLAPADPDWDHYRYRVFETIIPLRNVIWAKGTL
jgi:type IV pilus assembly protein PilW